MPRFVQAFLPIGPLAGQIDPKTRKVTDSVYQYRPQIAKVSGAEVSTRTFLDEDAAFCSAVIHSAVDCANGLPELEADFSVLHNPKATNAITDTEFRWCTQFVVRDDELHKLEPIRRG
jgi:hypothetical protein